MSTSAYYIGIISGTSIDAVDCALVGFDSERPTLVRTLSHPYDPALRQQIFDLCSTDVVNLKLLGEADIAIGRTFAQAAVKILAHQGLQPADVAAIGSHGQTIFHYPVTPFPFTIQLGDPNTIARDTGIPTVADFRRMDMAAGGQGAPLAPLFHRSVFQSPNSDRVIVNIGGIANISVLSGTIPFTGFDTGPGNVLMDYWIHKNRQLSYDDNGSLAASGKVSPQLLQMLLAEEYFHRQPPKSTGRELFNGKWLHRKLSAFVDPISVADVQATLLELTAVTIADAIKKYLEPDGIYVCGGGAFNGRLMDRLSQLFSGSFVDSTSAIGIAPDWVEAVTFAWLARQRMEKIPVVTSLVTGSTGACILGGLYLP